MRINFTRAVIAGVIGTVAVDLVGFALTGVFWDIPTLLGTKFFGEGALIAGAVAHYFNGVLLAVIYAGLAPSLWGNRWARAMTYVTAETVFGVWLFMGPLLGGGLLGLKLGTMFPVISLVRHWAYGAALATLYPLEVAEESKEAASIAELQPA